MLKMSSRATRTETDRSPNQLLTRLPKIDYDRLAPHLQEVFLDLRQIIYKTRSPIDYVYFPTNGMLSAMTVMSDGSAIEVATIGREGMSGLSAFIGGEPSPNEVIVQVAGEAIRLKADALSEHAKPGKTLHRLLVAYNSAYMTQVSYSVACNGLHTVQKRCARWLLMTQDRVGADVFPLTHEFLAIMLGVRRPSVTEVLGPLQEAGIISNHRGTITVLDRRRLEDSACECYKAVADEFARLFEDD